MLLNHNNKIQIYDNFAQNIIIMYNERVNNRFGSMRRYDFANGFGVCVRVCVRDHFLERRFHL